MKIVKNSMWVFALAIAATLAGCSADSEPTGGEPNPFDPSEPTPLEISSTLEAGMEAAVSRATPAPVTLTAGNIGIFLEGTGYAAKNNINYKGTSGVWSANAPAETLLLTGLDASVCAYYPYNNSGYGDKTKIAMTTQEYAANKLFYYAPNQTVNGTRAGRTVRFAMTHAYARVQLHISRKEYPTECTISAISFNNSALPKEGTLNITNRTYTISTTGDFAFTTHLSTTLGEGQIYTRDLLVVPQTADMSSPTTVKMIVDTKSMTATIPVSALKRFEAGKLYDIRIVIQGTQINIGSVSVEDWVSVSVGNGSGYVPLPGGTPVP